MYLWFSFGQKKYEQRQLEEHGLHLQEEWYDSDSSVDTFDSF